VQVNQRTTGRTVWHQYGLLQRFCYMDSHGAVITVFPRSPEGTFPFMK